MYFINQIYGINYNKMVNNKIISFNEENIFKLKKFLLLNYLKDLTVTCDVFHHNKYCCDLLTGYYKIILHRMNYGYLLTREDKLWG